MQQSNFDRNRLVEGGQGRTGTRLRKESKVLFWMFATAIVVLALLAIARVIEALARG